LKKLICRGEVMNTLSILHCGEVILQSAVAVML